MADYTALSIVVAAMGCAALVCAWIYRRRR